MNSFERVKAALHFSSPDRVPIFKVGLGDVFPMMMLPSKNWQPGHRENERGLYPNGIDDLVIKLDLWKWKKPNWAKKDPKLKDKKWLKIPREEIDEWGCIWKRRGGNKTMGNPGRASLTDWSYLNKYIQIYSPEADDKSRYSFFVKLSKLFGRKRYRLCALGHVGPSQTASMIRGFSPYLIDHRKNPEKLRELLSHLTDFYVKNIKMWIKYDAQPNGFLLVDDLGEQSGPFFSPKIFKEFYQPVYQRIFQTAHDYGCEMHLHCCGKVDRLLPDLIEWGLDAIEFDSPRMSGYPDLKPFRGKIMFWGCVNIQSLYTKGTPDESEREVWHMMRNLGTKNGGYGAYFYPQTHHIQVPKANIKAFEKGLKKYGIYSRIPESWWEYPVINDWKDDVVPPLPLSEESEN